MRSVRLKELPPSVVDDFVNMQLRSSQSSRLGVIPISNGPTTSPSIIGTPTSGSYKVEYRLVNKKHKNKSKVMPPPLSDSPSSLRYSSPIPPPPGHVVLKPIQQNNNASKQVTVPDRAVVKTPELVKISISKIDRNSDSIDLPLSRNASSRDISSDRSRHPTSLDPIQQQAMVTRGFSDNVPVITHKFVCPQCQCCVVKELAVVLTDDTASVKSRRCKLLSICFF